MEDIIDVLSEKITKNPTAEIVKIAEECIKEKYDTTTVCIDDYKFNFCKGCRTCHSTKRPVRSSMENC